ncbi:unnamed protein product [Caenorhabditis angaria]|uniref:Uncharacterized protein n=1 Tax=Caenorhabditis angaria TaxID=860376 RepID=A0A9P1IGT4_9PELO|nr:unnamed protein product [Caenorhabditis angaria]
MSEPEPPSFCCCCNGRNALIVLSLLSIIGVGVSAFQSPQLNLLPSYGISILLEFFSLYALLAMKSGPLKYSYWIMSLSLFLNVIGILVAPIYVAVEFASGFTKNSILGTILEEPFPYSTAVEMRKSFGFYFGYIFEAALLFNILFCAYRISIVLQLLEIARYRESTEIKKIPLA